MNARVRSPGSSASVTAPAAVGAALAVGVLEAAERLHQLQRLVGVGELDRDRRGLLGEQAGERRAAGHRGLGEDPLLGLGELMRAGSGAPCAGSGGRRRARRTSSSSSARSSSSSFHSRSKNRSVVCSAAERSRTCCISAPTSGETRVDGEGERGVGAGAPGEVGDRLELAHRLGDPGRVELGDLAAVALGERVGALLRLVELGQRALGPAAVDQRLEVPAGGGEGLVGRSRSRR